MLDQSWYERRMASLCTRYTGFSRYLSGRHRWQHFLQHQYGDLYGRLLQQWTLQGSGYGPLNIPGKGSDSSDGEMDFCAAPRYPLGVHMSGATAWFRLYVSRLPQQSATVRPCADGGQSFSQLGGGGCARLAGQR
eukprot:8220815-Pyramimonas_sp.AAC.1